MIFKAAIVTALIGLADTVPAMTGKSVIVTAVGTAVTETAVIGTKLLQ